MIEMESSMQKITWFIRLLVVLVLLSNCYAAMIYILNPSAYAASFELAGIPGMSAVYGVGILFLMWQVPYVFAAINPIRFRVSLLEAVIMQLIGLAGETLLLSKLPVEYALLRRSISRFILFDAIGFIFLLSAWYLTFITWSNPKKRAENAG